MRTLIRVVLKLQKSWNYKNTGKMKLRGTLIRKRMRNWLQQHRLSLVAAGGPSCNDLAVEGRDGTGRKSEIPWVRIHSQKRSPSAQQGWYCVYLFSASGNAAYLCIAHGSTRYLNGEFKPKPDHELIELVDWARAHLGSQGIPSDLESSIDLETKGELGPAYELGILCAKKYEASNVPPDSVLLNDLGTFCGILGRIYDADDLGRSPEGGDHQAREVQETLTGLLSPRQSEKARSSGQGFGLSLEERIAVEKHAMHTARVFLCSEGFLVKDVSASRPYDFVARADGKTIVVEVKGTTGLLGSIILTANEVATHVQSYPDNALIIVHSISLERSTTPPKAFGGVVHCIRPWALEQGALKPLSYQYRFDAAKSPSAGGMEMGSWS